MPALMSNAFNLASSRPTAKVILPSSDVNSVELYNS